jgi:hypothetical protein
MLMTLLPPTTSNPSAGGSLIDHATADWRGQTFAAHSKSGIVPAMARVLIEAGCPDQAWRAERDGAVVMSGPSLARVALLSVSDGGDGDGPRFTNFRPFILARAS